MIPRSLNAIHGWTLALALAGSALVANPPPAQAANDAAVSVTGELLVAIADDFPGKRSHRIYFVEDKHNGHSYQLEMPRQPRATGRSGAAVTLRGVVRGNRLILDEAGVQQLEAATTSSATTSVTTEPTGTITVDANGTQVRQTLVMVSKFNDAAVSCSSSDLDTRFFSDPNKRSIDGLYRETSLGKVGFGGKVTSPLPVNDTATNRCDLGGWATALDTAAKAAGLDPALYEHRVYVLPKESSCSLGVGSVGGSPGKVWVERCDVTDAFAHELGHNLGMNHASTATDEYGDTSDIMGYSGVALRQLNAPHQEQMGWRSAAQAVVVTASGTYDIAPLELSEAQAVAPQMLKIAKPDTGGFYYLSYRQPLGFDANLNTGYLLLNVHRYAGNGARTFLLGRYDTGQSFVDSVNGITVTAVSRSADYLTVQVQMNASCTRATPQVSVAPSSQTAAAGTPLSYVASVRNMDSAACPASTFGVSVQSLPSGWTAVASSPSVSLAAGASADTSLLVTSSTSAATGTYTFAAVAQDSTLSRSASGSATYAVASACVRAAPSVALTPADQSGAGGEMRSYTIDISNRDSTACAASTFAVSGTIPSGWTGTLSAPSVSLSPGKSTQTTLAVTPPSSAAAAVYAVTAKASDSSVSTHAATASGTYAVVTSNTDTLAPSAPTGLAASVNSAKKRVGLAWLAASDNVAVTGYRVYRDGVRIATTSSTSYTDGSVVDSLTHLYYVTAFDAAGNESPASNTVTTAFVAKRGGK